MLKVYNTMTRRKEEFKPLKEGEVSIYCCGVTPYNHPHIGNARPFVTWDVIRRYFAKKGYKVHYIQNFTDVDDKIINAANKEGVTWKDISDRYIKAYFETMDALNVRHADVYPRVSETMPEIIAMVEKLIAKGYAYVVDNGDVYYSVEKFSHYGKLSGRSLDDMQAGARIEVNTAKHHPMDFALWKAAKPGEPSWDSPWGKGRPGWHIECSTMSLKYLGEKFDFHGGGSDLIFPHHENEIAQSEAANDKTFANYWMHNGFLNIDNKKMSKSLGNFFTVREIGEKYDLQVLRFFMLSAHYSSPINFSAELMEASKNGLERIITCAERLKDLLNKVSGDALTEAEQENKKNVDELVAKFETAMDDDFNTADAVSAIFELVKLANSTANEESTRAYAELLAETIAKLSDVLGIITERKAEVLDSEVEELIAARQQARKEKNFALADEIRQKLLDMGIVLEDTREGVKWKRA